MLFAKGNKLLFQIIILFMCIIFIHILIFADTNEVSVLSNASETQQPVLTNTYISNSTNVSEIQQPTLTNTYTSDSTNTVPVITNTSMSIKSNEASDKTDISISNRQITNKEVLDYEDFNLESNYNKDHKEDLSNNTTIKSKSKIALMGEFGLGNVVSLYGAYDLGSLFIGAGIGYYYYDDDENETSISVFEPAILVMKQFDISKYKNLILTRIRVGIDLISEERFGLSGQTYCISPDVMIQLKGIFAGIGLHVIIGKKGNSVVLSIGA